MDVFECHTEVIKHVTELIADFLDVNRKHIKILGIEEGHKIGRGFTNYSIERVVSFELDGEQRKAVWYENRWNENQTTDNVSLLDQD